MRMRLSIAWETLRYKRTVEVLKQGMTFDGEVARYGRCEEIPTDVQQNGK
jgi:hypothetical protein